LRLVLENQKWNENLRGFKDFSFTSPTYPARQLRSRAERQNLAQMPILHERREKNDYKITTRNLSNGFIVSFATMLAYKSKQERVCEKENRIFCRHRKVIRAKPL
jgi:hypothetical protein